MFHRLVLTAASVAWARHQDILQTCRWTHRTPLSGWSLYPMSRAFLPTPALPKCLPKCLSHVLLFAHHAGPAWLLWQLLRLPLHFLPPPHVTVPTRFQHCCHRSHSSVHKSLCARGPGDPTHLCLAHFSHLDCSPTHTSSESETISSGLPGILFLTACSAAVSSALVIVCFSCTVRGNSLFHSSFGPNHTP